MNEAAANTVIGFSPCYLHIPGNGIAGSNGGFLFNFFENLPYYFCGGYMILHSFQ